MRSLSVVIPSISLDCMVLQDKRSDAGESDAWDPVVVMHCRRTRQTWACVFVFKRFFDSYSVNVMEYMIAFTGHKRIILKSDGESSTAALEDSVKASSKIVRGV